MGYQVLIVDDEPLIRQGIKNKIDWRGYKVDHLEEAGDGIEALEKIESLNPDIVITDIKMPELDGLQLIEEANKKNYYPFFIIISGYAEFDYAQKAINFGVKNYLLKPIDATELATAIHKITAQIEGESVISGGSFPLHKDAPNNFSGTNYSGEDAINETVKYIQEHFSENITLKSLARKYFINENYFCRIFKIITGKSFNDYLTEIRIKKACELLKGTQLSITEISALVGYEPKYFSKVFKKEMGVSPAEYLEKSRQV